MSKKHFIALAATLRASRLDMTPDGYVRLVSAMASLCEVQSSTFNRQHFIDACFTEPEA